MSNGMRKGLGYKDRPEHVKTEAAIAFERELDRTLEGGEAMSALRMRWAQLREQLSKATIDVLDKLVERLRRMKR